MLTLSICIPSYNRFEKLNETIKKILECDSNDFEVVIVDNCSPRNIEEYIDCQDARLKIVHRKTPVKGEKSVNECIAFASGEYALLLLDKDVIEGKFIKSLILELQKCKPMGGYCELNSNNNNSFIFDINPIIKFGYLSKHPSGNIYKTDVVKEYISTAEDIIGNDAFGFDYCLAYCASKGSMLLYDKPLAFSVLSNAIGKPEKSLSFNPQNNNVFYFPKNRKDEFMSFVSELDKLIIDDDVKLKVLRVLYYRTIRQVTIDYRKIMMDKHTCYHYGHDMKRVSILEMLRNYFEINRCIDCMEYSFLRLEDKIQLKKLVYVKLIYKILGKAK